MNAVTDGMARAEAPPEATAPAGIAPLRQLHWVVRRELWENRSLYLAPLIVAGVALAGFFVSLVGLPARMRAAAALDPAGARAAIEQPYLVVALMLMAVEMLVAAIYCLDALYGERRDRSILFWKSLPVSDLTTVLAKATIPILVLPLIAFAVTVATQLFMMLASSAVLAASGEPVAPLWTHVPFVRTSLVHLGHLVAFHGLWYAPLYGWLLLASAWARRVPILWATLPPVAIGLGERIAFGTSHFAGLLRHRFLGGGMAMGGEESGGAGAGMTMDMLTLHSPAHFLMSPGFWLGLLVTGGFLLAAVRLRRARGPI